ncbi:TonB-dependent receptor [candidate division KSB1 bacterium]|nr:TonB-dependent receptor [candidate division KSB1 bacterium]
MNSANASSKITGNVIDKKTKRPLIGANVQVLGTLLGASSDAQGNFLIQNIRPGSYSIRVSMMGYRTITNEKCVIQENETTKLLFELEETSIEFDPIVVTAGKIEQRLDQAPVSISVITAKEISTKNPVNLIEALEAASGINFIGNQINIRGSTGYAFGAGNKVLLLLDGVPVYASDTGEFNWDLLPPLDIDRIEVLKGAGSTLWGASALGGVINIITKSPTAEGKFICSTKAGKYDQPHFKEWQWTNPDRLYYIREDVSYNKKMGRTGFHVSAGHSASTGFTQLGDFQKYNLTGKIEYQFPNDIKWTTYAAYNFVDRGFFVQWKGQNDPYEVDETNLNNFVQLNQLNLYTKIAIPFSSRFAMNLRSSFVRTLMGNQFGEGNNFNPAFGQGLELQSNWIPHPHHQVTIGLQYQSDAGSAKFFGDHRGFFLGPYLQDEWKIRENVRLTAGFRYDRYQLIGYRKEDLFSPRLGINWQPWQSTSFRASIGSGFRAATIVERFLELSVMNFKIISNPALKAESCHALDLGIRHYFSRNWNIDISLFNNEYFELIEAHLDLIRGQIQFRNIPRARIRGIEATSNISVPMKIFGFMFTQNLQANITAMDHQDLKWNDPLPYRPQLLATLKSSYLIGKAQLHIDYRYASRIEAVKLYPINDRVSMKFLDTRLSYDLGNFTIQLGASNLLQYNYAPMESNLMPMRTFTVSILGEF